MSVKLKPVSEQVMVITGATSGIGLATAKEAASKGARVVLAARTREALDEAAAEITSAGGEALAQACDVGDRAQVQAVAEAAVQRFGRIDTWVNNAGVSIAGRIEETSEEDMRRLFETNFWGEVYGSLAAVPHLEAQGGALINMGSMASDRAIPLQGVYSASKHAVKAFTDALRMELEERGAPVSVTLIKPASIGTPMAQHVKSYTGREPRLPPPVYAPEEVAAAILHAAAHPKRDIFVGSAAATVSALGQAAPRFTDRLSEMLLFKLQLGPKTATATDNLHRGRSEARVRGDAHGGPARPSLYTRAAMHPGLTAAVVGGLAAAVAGGMAASRRRA